MCRLAWSNGGLTEASTSRVEVEPQPLQFAWLNGKVPEASTQRVRNDPKPPPFNIFRIKCVLGLLGYHSFLEQTINLKLLNKSHEIAFSRL